MKPKLFGKKNLNDKYGSFYVMVVSQHALCKFFQLAQGVLTCFTKRILTI